MPTIRLPVVDAMVISDRHRYLYFVIPKCGSATVRHALAPYTDIGYPVSDFEQHVTIRKFLTHYDDEDRFARSFKFTFVRNPYDRLYSGFRQDKIASTRWKPWIEAKKPIFDVLGDDFNAYMQKCVAEADIRHAWDWICFCPMTAFSHRGGQCALDWVGRNENLEADLMALADKLDVTIDSIESLNVRTPLHDKATDQPRHLAHYTRDTVALVNTLYADDFQAFDYPLLDPADFPLTL